MVALKLRKFGNSVGVIFPQAALDALHVDEGDTLYLTSSADGLRLTPYSPEFEAKTTVAGDHEGASNSRTDHTGKWLTKYTVQPRI